MQITALYKIFRGYEFFEASIRSIYQWVDRIVFVSSEIGWDGSRGNNTLEVVKKYDDFLNKIHIINFDTHDQGEQYAKGMEFIQRETKTDWVLLIDSDEVWDDSAWIKAMNFLRTAPPRINCFCSSMHTYIKTPRYRVADDKGMQVKPRVFVRSHIGNIGIRGSSVTPMKMMDGVYVHHFALVRDSLDEVFRKMTSSRIGDRHVPPLVDLNKWKAETWDKIPGPAQHYYQGCQGIWEKTIEVTKEDLPPSIWKLMEEKYA